MLINLKSKSLVEKSSFQSERELHDTISSMLDTLFGVRLIKNEYQIEFFDSETCIQTKGRIDSLGIDINGYPVIIEYKLDKGSTIINQALYYLDWLKINKRLFEFECQEKFGSCDVDFTNVRVICIAKRFDKYDYNAVRQINANVELYTYEKYEDYIDINTVYQQIKPSKIIEYNSGEIKVTDLEKALSSCDENVHYLIDYIEKSLNEIFGDEIERVNCKNYIAFKLQKNLITLVIRKNYITVYTNNIKKEYIDGEFVKLPSTNHWGTGNQKIDIKKEEEAKKLIAILDI